MSELARLVLFEVPILPPGHLQEPLAHLPEVLVMAVGIPVVAAVAMLVLAMGPTWWRSSTAAKAEVEVSR